LSLQTVVCLIVLAMCLGAAATSATSATSATARKQVLLAEAQRWGIKVHQHFDAEEIRLVFPCSGLRTKQIVETITPGGILLAKQTVPLQRTCALATVPFAQHIPMPLARRYLSRDGGCLVMDDSGDGSIALVQANIMDFNDDWFRDCKKHELNETDDLNEALHHALGTSALRTATIDPEAIRQLRILARKMFGAVADEKQLVICARRCQNQGLVFVGRAEDIHLFLRSDAVRKELGITGLTQRGYTSRDNKASSFFKFCSRDTEVELGAWQEQVAMYHDDNARTHTTVQPLWQFEREKQLGKEISDATCMGTAAAASHQLRD